MKIAHSSNLIKREKSGFNDKYTIAILQGRVFFYHPGTMLEAQLPG